MKKSFLFTFTKSPYGGLIAQEALDQALVAAAFDQSVGFLFIDSGIEQLLKVQNGHVVGRKNIAKLLKSTPLYGVEHFYVHKESLEARQLSESDLVLPVTLLSNKEIAKLMQEYDLLLGDE